MLTSTQREADPPGRRSQNQPEFSYDDKAVKRLRLIAVAYSAIEREWFPTDEAYQAELEVETRAKQVVDQIQTELGVPAKGYPADQYFLTNILVDKPDLVVNLVDTVKGIDRLQTSIPGALELTGIPYTGAGMTGLVIGNNKHLVKEILDSYKIPTPPYQLIKNPRMKVDPKLHLPLIVKLNESGGSVGVDNRAVKDTFEETQDQVKVLITKYLVPVIVEQFIEGVEITATVFDDGRKRHVFLGQKVFNKKIDGKHYFTSLESYGDKQSYRYGFVSDRMARKINDLAALAFTALRYRDYAKFDIRVSPKDETPFFIDANPNTAFGPHLGLPFTEVLALHNIEFKDVLKSLISKHAKRYGKTAETLVTLGDS